MLGRPGTDLRLWQLSMKEPVAEPAKLTNGSDWSSLAISRLWRFFFKAQVDAAGNRAARPWIDG